MPFPVSHFVIGAQKSGTTSMASLLASQPDICVSSPKEPLFFSKQFSRGFNWYEDCFEQPERRILVDASPDYSRGPTDLFPVERSYDGAAFQCIPQRIHGYNPEARFIYILRNPVTRTYSSFWHNVRAGYEEGNFSESIRTSDRYLVASDYLGQLKNFLQFFSIEQFHFILFEKFVRDSPGELQRCCEFLNIDYKPVDARTEVHKNASYVLSPTAKKFRGIFGSEKRFKRFAGLLQAALPQSAQTTLKSVMTRDIPKISASDRAYLVQLFSDRNAQLAELASLDLSVWKGQS